VHATNPINTVAYRAISSSQAHDFETNIACTTPLRIRKQMHGEQKTNGNTHPTYPWCCVDRLLLDPIVIPAGTRESISTAGAQLLPCSATWMKRPPRVLATRAHSERAQRNVSDTATTGGIYGAMICVRITRHQENISPVFCSPKQQSAK
jgi:hypothetical protein